MAGIIKDLIVGPFFLPGTYSDIYLDLFENVINPASTNIIDCYRAEYLIFQPDGAPPHNAMLVRQFVNETFQDWIGSRRTTEWPHVYQICLR